MKVKFAYLALVPLMLASCASYNSQTNSNNGTNNQTSNTTVTAKPDSPTSYYGSVDVTKNGQALRDDIHAVISKGRRSVGYGGLYSVYADADVDEQGYIVDMYSNITKFRASSHGGNYGKEGDIYNREHVIPQSWWGKGTDRQGCDPFIVYPTDAYINGMRSNYPFGEVKSASKQSKNGYSKLGSSKLPGYSSTVFEPNDEYKGDLARVYFYAIACYDDAPSWTSSNGRSTFSRSGTVGLTDYARKLFMKWHLQDPVSDWEVKRNNAVEGHTHNRNPFIDHPEWANQIWGTETF